MMLEMQEIKMALQAEDDRYVASVQFAVGKDFSRNPYHEPEDRHAWLITLTTYKTKHFFTGITLDSAYQQASDWLTELRYAKPYAPPDDWESKILDQADADRSRARVEGKTKIRTEITSTKEWR